MQPTAARAAERKWALWFAVAVAIATTLPYLIGFSRQGDDWRFTGFLFAVEDGNSYIAKMLTGAAGDWLFRTPYTPYPQRGFLAFLPYLLLGKLASPPGLHEQLTALYHLFRIAAAVLMVKATYDFLSLFLKEVRWRRWGTAVAVLGGGLGWLAVWGFDSLWQGRLPGLDQPLEFYSPEIFGFLMVYGLPHLAMARALLLWGLCRYLAPLEPKGERNRRVQGGLLWLVMGLMQPLTVAVGWAVLGVHLLASGAWLLWQKRREQQMANQVTTGEDTQPLRTEASIWWGYFQRAVWMGLISAPIVVYNLLAFRLDPFLSAWESQNLIISPYFSHYLLAYALLLPLAILGIKPALVEAPWRGWLPVAWMAVFPLLAYAPYNLQRRLPEGVWVAITVLAFLWIESQSRKVTRWIPAFLSLSFFSTGLLLLAGLAGAMTPQTPHYRPIGEVQAFLALQENAPRRSVILASYETSNPLPAWVPAKTLTGHGPESIHLAEIEPRVECFYQPTCPMEERLALLREYEVDYVFWGPQERSLGDWDLHQANFLNLVYESGAYSIFQVDMPMLSK